MHCRKVPRTHEERDFEPMCTEVGTAIGGPTFVLWCDSAVHIPWGKYMSTYVYTWQYKLSFVPILVAHCTSSSTKPFSPQHWKQNVRLNFFGGSGKHSWMGRVLHFAFKKSLFRSFYGWNNNKVDSEFQINPSMKKVLDGKRDYVVIYNFDLEQLNLSRQLSGDLVFFFDWDQRLHLILVSLQFIFSFFLWLRIPKPSDGLCN